MSGLATYDVSAAWVLAATLAPLLAAAACALRPTRAVAPLLVALAALPACAAGLLAADVSGEIFWLGTGVQVALDPAARAFLLASALIWTASGLYAYATIGTRRTRFFGFFALAMAGNLGLTVAHDPASFYTLFSLMALSTYVLVIHPHAARPSAENPARPGDAPGLDPSRRAGRVYLAFTVVGEAVLLSGFFIIMGGGLALAPLGAALVLLAFGVKVGMPGAHGWMPVAYAAAPPAAAAALAGAMSTSGVLGVVRFLPGGGDLPPGLATAVIVLGLVAAFGGAVVGVTQREPAVVLAYSSISQFGLITVLIGAGLTSPVLWPLAVTAATVYAVHHGLAKAALFLGGDVVGRLAGRASGVRVAALVLLALPALALAGLPLTSGAVAKIVLKGVTGELLGPWHDVLEVALPLAAAGTTVLVVRFLVLVATRSARAASAEPARPLRAWPALASWLLLSVAVASTVWLWPAEEVRYAAEKSVTASYLWLSTWPVLLGGALAAAVWFARAWASRAVGVLAPGDVYAPVFDRAHAAVEERSRRMAAAPAAATSAAPPQASASESPWARMLGWLGAVESGLIAWATAISAVGVLTVIALLLAARG